MSQSEVDQKIEALDRLIVHFEQLTKQLYSGEHVADWLKDNADWETLKKWVNKVNSDRKQPHGEWLSMWEAEDSQANNAADEEVEEDI